MATLFTNSEVVIKLCNPSKSCAIKIYTNHPASCFYMSTYPSNRANFYDLLYFFLYSFLVTIERIGLLVGVEQKMMTVNLDSEVILGSGKMGFERILSSIQYIQQFK